MGEKWTPHSDFSHRLNLGLIVAAWFGRSAVSTGPALSQIVAVGAVLVAGFLAAVSGVDGDISVKWGTVPVM